jgi:hypothetical protein
LCQERVGARRAARGVTMGDDGGSQVMSRRMTAPAPALAEV